MQSMMTVMNQVVIMMILIAVGFVMTKRGMITEKGTGEITTLLLRIVTPCLIVNSLLGVDEPPALGELAMAMLCPALAIVIAMLISWAFFKKEPIDRKKVLRFSVTFSNAGFMGLPLVQGIVGPHGVVLGSFFVVVFNLICWTYGYGMMSGGKPNVKAALLNPGVIGLVIGLPLCFAGLDLPSFVTQPIALLANLNTPLAMLVIGSYVARVHLKDFLTDSGIYLMAFLRLVAAPGLFLLVLMLLRPERDLFLSSAIQASSAVAANAVLFAVEYHGDSKLASGTVAISTLFSIITIPTFALLAQLACQALKIS